MIALHDLHAVASGKKANATCVLPMGGFYQFGFVTSAIEPAIARLDAMFGVTRVRRRQTTDWMETAHAWTGESMIEVIALGEGAPLLYSEYLPAEEGVLRLHHLGRRIETREAWDHLQQAIEVYGLLVPFGGSAMNDQLHFAYVDTRAELGIYSEYVYLSGEALRLYDDVPQNY